MAKDAKNLTPVIPGEAAPPIEDPVLDAGAEPEPAIEETNTQHATGMENGGYDDEESEDPGVAAAEIARLTELNAEQSAAKDDQIAELLRRVITLEAELKAAGIEVKTKLEVIEKDLPSGTSVNPDKITGKVLTKDGWVLPTETN